MTGLAFLIDREMGRILLAVSIIWVLATWLHSPPDFTEELKLPTGEITVEEPPSRAAGASAAFPTENVREYTAGERFVFVAERKVAEFHPVDLDVPDAGIRQAPPMLPSPGPSLEGAMKLVRSGAALPRPAEPPPPPPKP